MKAYGLDRNAESAQYARKGSVYRGDGKSTVRNADAKRAERRRQKTAARREAKREASQD